MPVFGARSSAHWNVVCETQMKPLSWKEPAGSLEESMKIVQEIKDYEPSPDDFYQIKTVKPAAIWATLFALSFTGFNFLFLYSSMGGNFTYLNTLFAGWATVLIADRSCWRSRTV